MTTRLVFHTELRVLEDSLLGMADSVGGAIEHSIRALDTHDAALARQVVEDDEEINNRYSRIEQGTLALIATQQPLASDLREIMAISAVATDLERIGDHARGIATIALRVMDEPGLQPITAIERMADLNRELLAGVVDAFIRRDGPAAQRVAARDDEIDALYGQVYHRLISDMTAQPSIVERASRQLWVAKSLERIGDHVTNIAERVVFVTSGEIVELNR